VEVVSCHKPIKDGRTVRQLLIDSYAANHPKDEQEEEDEKEEEEEGEQRELQQSVQDLRKGKKYPTPFLTQLWILAQRTFKQRRAEILCWRQVVLIVVLAVLSGLLWLRLDKDGALPLCSLTSTLVCTQLTLERQRLQRSKSATATDSCSSGIDQSLPLVIVPSVNFFLRGACTVAPCNGS
jgi:hypothetical protein